MNIYETIKNSNMPFRKTSYVLLLAGLAEAMACRIAIPHKFLFSCIGYVLILLVFLYISIWLLHIKHTSEGVFLLIFSFTLGGAWEFWHFYCISGLISHIEIGIFEKNQIETPNKFTKIDPITGSVPQMLKA